MYYMVIYRLTYKNEKKLDELKKEDYIAYIVLIKKMVFHLFYEFVFYTTSLCLHIGQHTCMVSPTSVLLDSFNEYLEFLSI
jgi:hypothetical protein